MLRLLKLLGSKEVIFLSCEKTAEKEVLVNTNFPSGKSYELQTMATCTHGSIDTSSTSSPTVKTWGFAAALSLTKDLG
jgi:hypothetical protein